MQYVYVLQSKKSKQFYVGCAYDIKQRLSQHNSDKVPSTAGKGPFEVIYYEAYRNKYDAFFREKWLKTGWGRQYLRKSLHNTMKNLGG